MGWWLYAKQTARLYTSLVSSKEFCEEGPYKVVEKKPLGDSAYGAKEIFIRSKSVMFTTPTRTQKN